jgi:hypothetical protein
MCNACRGNDGGLGEAMPGQGQGQGQGQAADCRSLFDDKAERAGTDSDLYSDNDDDDLEAEFGIDFLSAQVSFLPH